MSSRRQPNLYMRHNQQQSLLGWPGARDPWKTLKPWLGPPHRGMMGGQGQGIQTPTESCLLSPTVLSVHFNHPEKRLDTVQVEGLGEGLPAVICSSGEGHCYLLRSQRGTWHPTHLFEVQKVAPIVLKMSTSTIYQPSSAWQEQNSTAQWNHKIVKENLQGTFAIVLSNHYSTCWNPGWLTIQTRKGQLIIKNSALQV